MYVPQVRKEQDLPVGHVHVCVALPMNVGAPTGQWQWCYGSIINRDVITTLCLSC